MPRLALLALIALLLTACPAPAKKSAKPAATPSASAPAAAATPIALDAVETPVICGCLIKEVGHCAEFALIEGKRVEIKNHGLGDMPFCGKGEELKAKITGTRKGDVIEATKVELVK